MGNPIAVLVEDDPESAAVARMLLEEEKFEVVVFDSIAPVLDYLKGPPELIDLFVLDRRLPVRIGDNASDEIGDELLAQVARDHPDSRIIVFTGFASIDQVQMAVRGSSPLPDHQGMVIDRISVLQKTQSLDFRDEVRQLRGLIQSLEDIEIVAGDLATMSDVHKRMLRRLAHHYKATVVAVEHLTGGLTEAAVWRCELRGSMGPVGTVVAKQGKRGKAAEAWLTELLPKAFVATSIARVTGLMDGRSLNIFQVAGDKTISLMELLDSNLEQAIDVSQSVWQVLGGLPSQPTVQRIDDICAPFVEWDILEDLLEKHQIPVPSASLTVSTEIGVRHCDLHPGNVLIADGQAVLIDFDSCAYAAGVLDPVTALISTLVHPDSPIRGAGWPDAAEISASFGTPDFGSGHRCSTWFRAAYEWIFECRSGDREFWSLVLGYAVRQLQYDDVTGSRDVVDRVLALARLAATKVSE